MACLSQYLVNCQILCPPFSKAISCVYSKRTNYASLMLSALGKIFSRQHTKLCFLIYPRKQVWHFMQTVSNGDNLETICIKCQILFFGRKNQKNIINLLSAEFAQSVVKANKFCSCHQNIRTSNFFIGRLKVSSCSFDILHQYLVK